MSCSPDTKRSFLLSHLTTGVPSLLTSTRGRFGLMDRLLLSSVIRFFPEKPSPGRHFDVFGVAYVCDSECPSIHISQFLFLLSRCEYIFPGILDLPLPPLYKTFRLISTSFPLLRTVPRVKIPNGTDPNQCLPAMRVRPSPSWLLGTPTFPQLY